MLLLQLEQLEYNDRKKWGVVMGTVKKVVGGAARTVPAPPAVITTPRLTTKLGGAGIIP